MECSNIENDEFCNSERAVSIDSEDMLKAENILDESEMMAIKSLYTALENSDEEMIKNTDGLELNAFADPPLPTAYSIYSNNSMEEFREDYEVYDLKQAIRQPFRKVSMTDDGNVLDFEMNVGDDTVKVIDSNECLKKLESFQLEPVYFDHHYYLDVPKPRLQSIDELFGLVEGEESKSEESDGEESKSEESDGEESDEAVTAELGPTFSQFSQYSQLE